MRWWWVVFMVGCSGEGDPSASASASASASPSTSPSASPSASASTTVPLHFAWPTAEADVSVVSEHDFGGGMLVSARYHYRLAVARDERGYRITRSGIALDDHRGTERLRVGNVIAQDVTQHLGDLHVDADGTHIAAVEGFDPIEAAARSLLADVDVTGPLADAVVALDRSGWAIMKIMTHLTVSSPRSSSENLVGWIGPNYGT